MHPTRRLSAALRGLPQRLGGALVAVRRLRRLPQRAIGYHSRVGLITFTVEPFMTDADHAADAARAREREDASSYAGSFVSEDEDEDDWAPPADAEPEAPGSNYAKPAPGGRILMRFAPEAEAPTRAPLPPAARRRSLPPAPARAASRSPSPAPSDAAVCGGVVLLRPRPQAPGIVLHAAADAPGLCTVHCCAPCSQCEGAAGGPMRFPF